VLTGKPLFPGKNVVHQLDLMTDLLGTPSVDSISRVRNEKARRYLNSMRKKQPVPLAQKFPNADPLALKLLAKLLAFDPKHRPTAEEALADPYFKGLSRLEREPSCQPITKLEFEFERRRVTKEDLRELIFREILEYHPQLLKSYSNGSERTTFLYPSAVDQFRKQFAHLQENGSSPLPLERKHASLPRSTVVHSQNQSDLVSYSSEQEKDKEKKIPSRKTVIGSQRIPKARPGKVVGPGKDAYDPRLMIRSPVMQQSNSSSSSVQKKHTGKTEASQRDISRDNYYSHHQTNYMPTDRLGMNTTMIPSAGSLHKNGF